MNFGQKLLLAAAALLVPVLSHADPISGNPNLTTGGFSFSNFSCSTSGSGLAPGLSNCGGIDVSSLAAPDSGVRFSGGFGANLLSTENVLVSYDVNSVDPIYAMGLFTYGAFFGNSNATVNTSIFDTNNALVSQANVICDSNGCNGNGNFLLNGFYNDLHVIQSVTMSSGLGLTITSPIDNTFTAAPEPSTNALLGAGLVGGALLMRRRNAKKAQAAA